MQSRIVELEEAVEASTARCSGLEKAKSRLAVELEDLMIEVERSQAAAVAAEKKQKQFDRVIAEWEAKYRDATGELESCQREARSYNTEIFRLKATIDETSDVIEGLRRDNKGLNDEIHDLTEQLTEGGRSTHEMDKMRRRLEKEKEELQQALEEAEAALEIEESKVMRAQLEMSTVRQEIDRRIQEKEEEFENTRRNHARALESMQATLEAESKGRAESMRLKKKLEQDVNELEVQLDAANRGRADAEKVVKKMQQDLREMQSAAEEESRQRNDLREQHALSERRCTMLNGEIEEIRTILEQAERGRKGVEAELMEAADRVNELSATNSQLMAQKRKLEGDLSAMNADLEEAGSEARAADERARKAAAELAHMTEELRNEQDKSMHLEKLRKQFEHQQKDLAARLEEAENNALRGGKRALAKMEERVSVHVYSSRLLIRSQLCDMDLWG